MKLGVLSDVHSNAKALEQVLASLTRRQVKRVICAGDLVGYYTQPNRVIELLEPARVESVMGNHDLGVLEGTPLGFNVYARRALDWNRRQIKQNSLKYIERLPRTFKTEISGLDVFVAHGSPKNPINEYVFEDKVDASFLDYSFEDIPDVVILGHTHVPYVKKIENTLILNPGSVGQPRDGNPKASFAIIDTQGLTAEIKRVEYDIESVVKEVSEYLPRQLGERLKQGR